MRKPLDVAPPSNHRRLALALLCAFAGCLNPRPEEYPTDTASPGAEAAGAPVADNPMRQGASGFEPNVASDPSAAPESTAPAEPTTPPAPLVPMLPAPADAGTDAGATDAGAPAISE